MSITVLENGDYQLEDGRVIPADEVGKLYEDEETKKDDGDELQEGSCKHDVQLND